MFVAIYMFCFTIYVLCGDLYHVGELEMPLRFVLRCFCRLKLVVRESPLPLEKLLWSLCKAPKARVSCLDFLLEAPK